MKNNIAIIYNNKNCFTNQLSDYIQAGIKKEGISSVTYDSEFISNNINLLDESEAIIIGTPTYFGNVSANIKKFMDSTTGVWDNGKWRNKLAAGFTHSSALSGDKLNALMSIFVFAQQHGMIWTGLDLKSNSKVKGYDTELNRLGSWVGLMAESPKKYQGNKTNISDIKTAEYFGMRIAKLTKMFNK